MVPKLMSIKAFNAYKCWSASTLPSLSPSLIMDFPLWKFATETHFNCSVNQSDIHSSKYFFVCSNHSFIPHRIWRVGTIICNLTTHQSTPPQKSSNWKMIASVAAATNIYLGLPKWDRFPWNEFLLFALKIYIHFFLINRILFFLDGEKSRLLILLILVGFYPDLQ